MPWWAGIPAGLLFALGGGFGLMCLLSRVSGEGWLGYWRWLLGKD